MRKIRLSGTFALTVLFLSLNVWAQQQVGVKVIESTDATGKVVKGLGVGAVTNSVPGTASPDFSLPPAPCSNVTSDGKAKKSYIAKFTSPCNVENSTVFEVTSKLGTVVNVRQGFAVDSIGFGGIPTLIGGCSGNPTLGSIAFGNGNNTCTGFSLGFGVGNGQATTLINAPSGGEVSIFVGGIGTGPIVSFNGKGPYNSNFHTPVYMFDALTAANGFFQVDSLGNVAIGGSSSGSLKVTNGPFLVDGSGNVSVAGNLNVQGQKNFQIDDPLDPANRYLYHSAVESSEMMNIYTGNVTTNGHGDASVQVPAWFQALNGDFRYQLTVIGQFAQAIVASEIRDSKFSIKTDKPSVKVSWQVTGVRQDAYARAHPLVVEQEKPPTERGYYLHPKLFGQPETKGINYARQHPTPVKEAEAGRTGQAN